MTGPPLTHAQLSTQRQVEQQQTRPITSAILHLSIVAAMRTWKSRPGAGCRSADGADHHPEQRRGR